MEMRQVVLDTETTGLEPAEGHRIIEIGCVELRDRRATGRRYHQYLCPDREIDEGALEVHGISNEFLKDSPRFASVANDFLEFVRGAELIIHNAPFDVGFLDHELSLLGPDWGRIEDYCSILDTLRLARELHPGQKNSLDALCKRYEVDNSQRELHGALLDAEILADVYLAMTGGQAALVFEAEGKAMKVGESRRRALDSNRPALPVIQPNEAEMAAHRRQLEAIDEASGGRCVWKALGDDLG